MDLTRTFGRLIYGTVDDGFRGTYSAWMIRAEPHVMMRAKRIFPRAKEIRGGDLVMSDLPENCAELDWLMLRWPLEMTHGHRSYLAEQVEAFHHTQVTVERIRRGELRLSGDDWLPLILEPYWWQIQYADHVLATGGGDAVHGIGLGKTYACELVLRAPHARPGLVFTLSGRMPKQWQESIQRHFPMLKAVLGPTGTPSRRRQSQMDEADVIILPYSRAATYAPRLKGWARTVIFDEAQELRHAGTDKYVGAATLADGADFVAGATATPVYGYAGEIWDVTDAIKNGALGTRAEFIREWGGVNRGAAGVNVSIANAGPLGAHLQEMGLMDVKSREDVGLPKEDLAVLPWEIDVTAELEVIHEAATDLETLARRVLARDGSTQERLEWNREIDHKMRRATGLAKAPGVIDLVQMLAAANEKVLLFAWHRDVYDVYLQGLANLNPVMFTGSESPTQKDRAFHRFRRDAQVCLMSLRAGAGLDGLQEFCAVGVLGELDWSPGIHTQNFGRLSRPGQTRPVAGYLTHCDFGADPVIMETLGVKTREEKGLRGVKMATEPVLSAGDRVRRMAEQILANQR